VEKFNKVFAKNLRALRKKARLRLPGMAEAAGIPERTYQRMESGVIPRKRQYLAQVAAFHGVPETRLFQDPSLTAEPRSQTSKDLLKIIHERDAEIEALKQEIAAQKRVREQALSAFGEITQEGIESFLARLSAIQDAELRENALRRVLAFLHSRNLLGLDPQKKLK
jgi:transcriptional regulator with XRE-family HTH domain